MSPGVDKAVQALLRGQESANQLKLVLEHPRTGLVVATEPLFDTILDSFSTALSFFTNFTSSEPRQSHGSYPNTVTPVARKSPKKNSYGEDGLENYRDDSPTPLHGDGFSWRKYGQKKIKTSTHQRCYFRCAYAKDQNCNATKRVQRIQDSPSVYRTTYVGKHICDVNAFSQSNEDITNGSKMIRFDKIDQLMSDLILPQLVSVDHQETIENEGTYHTNTMNQDYVNDELLVEDDDHIWAYQFPPFSPGNFMFLDDISTFDYNPFQV